MTDVISDFEVMVDEQVGTPVQVRISVEAGRLAIIEQDRKNGDKVDRIAEEVLRVNSPAGSNDEDFPPIASVGNNRRRNHNNGQTKEKAGSPDSLGLYLEEIGRHALLTKDDEVRLGGLVMAGIAAKEKLLDKELKLDEVEIRRLSNEIVIGEEAYWEFFQSNLKLVVSIARRQRSTAYRLSLLERVQLGSDGLMHAIEKFDPRKGFKFSTYAVWWIRQAITRGAAQESRVIPLPSNVEEKIYAYKRASERFIQKHNRPGTPEEIIIETRLKPEKVRDAMRFANDTLSLDKTMGVDGDLELGDIVADNTVASPEERAIESSEADSAHQILKGLGKTERRILELQFDMTGEGLLLDKEIAELLGISESRVYSLKQKALSKLRHPSSDYLLETAEWRKNANCRGVGHSLFFHARGESTKEAAEICSGCSVRIDCLKFALKSVAKYGYWGGESERTRRRMRNPK